MDTLEIRVYEKLEFFLCNGILTLQWSISDHLNVCEGELKRVRIME